eukprot:Lithocolla_globosa_v1_NODE_7160_length_984_cov_6.414424.p1 type:complete len:292 gc:universal NODE_7160_length_984_cov_6.414424:959-84(-)
MISVHLLYFDGHVQKDMISAVFRSNNLLQEAANKGRWPTSEEAFFALNSTIGHLQKHEELEQLPGVMRYSTAKNRPSANVEQTKDSLVTVKLFLSSNRKVDPKCISESVRLVLSEMGPGVDHIDNFILALSKELIQADEDDEDVNFKGAFLDTFLSCWKELEELHANHVVKKLGVADFHYLQLQQIKPLVKVFPHIDHVNLSQCCVMPRDLVAFAKESSLELLTHHDAFVGHDLLPTEKLHEAFRNAPPDSLPFSLVENTQVRWILRYTSFLQSRGVIADKKMLIAVEGSP